MKTLIGIVVFLCLGGVSHAHPHVFVNAKAGFQVDSEKRLLALRISWRYDAFTTLYLYDALDLDSDRDGELTDADLAVIAAAETDWPPDYNGDVHLSVSGESTKLARPLNAEAEMVEGEVIVSFDLPLATPVAMAGQRASLQLYDPVYYYAYSVTVDVESQEMDLPCEATANPFEPNDAAAETLLSLATLSREETPNDPNIGASFADEIVLTCS